jgi:hypothetical protein
VYISVSVYQQMSLTLHDDIISIYISVSVDQQMSITLDDDIISVYISVSTNVPNTTWRYNQYIYTNYIVM